MADKKDKVYNTFNDFYPFYLGEHSNQINRRLHLTGTTIVVLIFLWAILTLNFKILYYAPLVGYGFAWVGHFFFEKNKPATFKHPIYSLMGDFRMWYDCVSGAKKF